jgi:hypothetical protein
LLFADEYCGPSLQHEIWPAYSPWSLEHEQPACCSIRGFVKPLACRFGTTPPHPIHASVSFAHSQRRSLAVVGSLGIFRYYNRIHRTRIHTLSIPRYYIYPPWTTQSIDHGLRAEKTPMTEQNRALSRHNAPVDSSGARRRRQCYQRHCKRQTLQFCWTMLPISKAPLKHTKMHASFCSL